MQNALMHYDPATGQLKPYPSHAAQWRDFHGHGTAWLFNPWTGIRRDARDVGSDIKGVLITDAPTSGVLSGTIGSQIQSGAHHQLQQKQLAAACGFMQDQTRQEK